MDRPGAIVLFGSGETAAAGREALHWLPASGREPRSAVVLETPAGFEANAEAVAGRYARFLRRQPELHGARVSQVPARKRGTPLSPDAPDVAWPILGAELIALGAGSPTYAVRQLERSVAWSNVVAAHLLGATVFLASAAAIAAGTCALPVYEIYKVGEDPRWNAGLRLFEVYGLRLAVMTHWNNRDGGADLDTSRCYMGEARFDELLGLLPDSVAIVGIDEHTALAMDPAVGAADVIGRGGVTLVRDGQATAFESGARIPLTELGPFTMPDARETVADEVRREVEEAHVEREAAPPSVDTLVASRERARAARDWSTADRLREEIAQGGWEVRDTPDGPRVLPREAH